MKKKETKMICGRCGRIWTAIKREVKGATETELNGYCGCGNKLQHPYEKTIVIEMFNGELDEVKNLPGGYRYVVIQTGNKEED